MLSLIIKHLTAKKFQFNISIHSYKQQRYHITSIGKKELFLQNKYKSSVLCKTMSGEGDQRLTVNYNDIVEAQKDKNILIIDVRENYEIEETGKLPGSIHIPMAEVPDTLTNLKNNDFEEKFQRKKPNHNTKIVVSCKSGKRSAHTQSVIQKLGYKNVHNYVGGWMDWESHQKS